MNRHNLQTRLRILYFIMYGAVACVFPFFTVYFRKRGLSYGEIGIAFATNSIISVIFQPLWGIITDKYSNKKSTLKVAMIFSAVFALPFIFVWGFVPVILSLIAFMIFQSPILSVNDAYCYEIIEGNNELQYGKIRLMGSIGYAVISLILGMIIKHTGLNAAFISYIIFIAFSVIALKGINYCGTSSKSGINFTDVIAVLRDKRFILLSISAAIANTSMSANGNYLSVLIEKTGGDISNLGMLWFIVAMSELPVFFFGNRILKKVGVLNVYLMSLVIYICRFFMDSISTSYVMVLGIQILQGVTFPFYLMSTLEYISEITPSNTRTTAITAFTAIAAGVGGFIGNICGGFLLERVSVFYLFRTLSLLAFISLLVGVFLKFKTSYSEK